MTKMKNATFLAAGALAALVGCTSPADPAETSARPIACAIAVDTATALFGFEVRGCCTDASGNPASGCIPHEHVCSGTRRAWSLLRESIDVEWSVNQLVADYRCNPGGPGQTCEDAEPVDIDGDGVADAPPGQPYNSAVAEFFYERLDGNHVRIYKRPADAFIGSGKSVVAPTGGVLWSLLPRGAGFASDACLTFTFDGVSRELCSSIQTDEADCESTEC